MEEKQWLLVVGNVADGFTFHGPFDDAEEADEYASDNVADGVQWNIVPLQKPI